MATTTRIGDRLSAARHRGAVGREEELALLRAALDAAELPFSVLFLSGPGGVGKTTLLRAFASSCDASGIPVRAIDGRNLEPKPTAFLGALGEALGGGAAAASPTTRWPRSPRPLPGSAACS
jgi:Mrp family chromosome partitioning ATPase